MLLACPTYVLAVRNDFSGRPTLSYTIVMPGLVSCSDMKVVAVSTLGWDPLVSVAAELMRAGIAIPAASIRDNPDSLSDLLPK